MNVDGQHKNITVDRLKPVYTVTENFEELEIDPRFNEQPSTPFPTFAKLPPQIRAPAEMQPQIRAPVEQTSV